MTTSFPLSARMMIIERDLASAAYSPSVSTRLERCITGSSNDRRDDPFLIFCRRNRFSLFECFFSILLFTFSARASPRWNLWNWLSSRSIYRVPLMVFPNGLERYLLPGPNGEILSFLLLGWCTTRGFLMCLVISLPLSLSLCVCNISWW